MPHNAIRYKKQKLMSSNSKQLLPMMKGMTS